MINTADKRFQELKKTLEKLNFNQSFTIESAALVEKLLSDLGAATSWYHKVKQEKSQLSSDLNNERNKVASLSKELENKLNENNELHYNIIQVLEESKQFEMRFKYLELKFKSEIEDLQFLINSKDKDIKELEQQNIQARNILMNNDGSLININLIQDFNNTYPLKEIKKSCHNYQNSMSKDSEAMQNTENVNKTEDDIQILEAQMRKLMNTNLQLEGTIQFQNEQILVRDQEIQRLNKFHIQDSNINKITQEFTFESTNEITQNLKNQINQLAKENKCLLESIKEKDKIINISDKYKQDRMGFSQKYTKAIKDNKILRNKISELQSQIEELQTKPWSSVGKSIEESYPFCEFPKENLNLFELEEKVRQLEGEIRKHRRIEEELQYTIECNDSEKASLNNEHEIINQENKKLADSIDEKHHEIIQISKDNEKLREDIEIYKEKLKTMVENYDSLKLKYEQLLTENDDLRLNVKSQKEKN